VLQSPPGPRPRAPQGAPSSSVVVHVQCACFVHLSSVAGRSALNAARSERLCQWLLRCANTAGVYLSAAEYLGQRRTGCSFHSCETVQGMPGRDGAHIWWYWHHMYFRPSRSALALSALKRRPPSSSSSLRAEALTSAPCERLEVVILRCNALTACRPNVTRCVAPHQHVACAPAYARYTRTCTLRTSLAAGAVLALLCDLPYCSDRSAAPHVQPQSVHRQAARACCCAARGWALAAAAWSWRGLRPHTAGVL